MKRSFISILAVAGILISGCALEEAPSSEGSIRAIMENDETRTSVTDEGKFTWSAGDQIWLGTTSGSVIGTLSTGAGTASANFSYGSFFGEMTGKAVYPYNSGHSVKGDVLDMVLPASYDLGTSLQNTNAALYGVNVDGTLKFNHLAGVMRFKFKNVPAGVNQFVITLDKKINGTFEADLTADYPVLETSATEVEAEKTVTFNFDALTQPSDIMLYVPLPLGTYNSLGLALNNAEKSVWTYSNTVTNTIKRKKLILMPTVTLSGSIDGDLEGEETPADAVNLSENGTANSYIVSEAGSYKFTPTKGNSNESVGAVASAAILWESFGTNVTPNIGDLVKNAVYSDGCITFETAETFKEGNALIAAKDASGNILWSWHIWLTDEPQGQEYYNNAGTMMDRNLGATSATPGDVGALGLLYQWGRKDPFLGSSSISSDNVAKSTITWSSSVKSDSSNGTIAYATSNPTTFIKHNVINWDWYYTGSSSTDNTRWTTSESNKSIYDPCPAGWRVPDGGNNGVWSKALGSSSSFKMIYSSASEGMNFSNKFGSLSIWYPASGYLNQVDGYLWSVAAAGYYWSASSGEFGAYCLYFNDGEDGETASDIEPSYSDNYANGLPVRCIREDSMLDVPEEPQKVNYVDEYGINRGQGIEIDGVVWAPVNCGYHETDYQYGKLYQWGRKYGQGYDSSDASVPSIVSDPVSLSVGQSSSNSNKFYTSTSSYYYDWVTPQNSTLWNSGTEADPVKTEYDPCPDGWRVPTENELIGLISNKSSWTTNDGQNGYWFSGSNAYSESVSRVFLPAAGGRGTGSTAANRGDSGFYWPSSPYGSHSAYFLYFYSSIVNMNNYDRGYGFSVRCVQE